MINWLKYVPDSGDVSFFEQLKFAMTWRLCVITFLILFPLSSVIYFFGYNFFVNYSIISLIILLGIIYMYKTKRYREVSIVITIAATLSISSSLFFVRGAFHILEMLWLVVVSLFAFFTLGKHWGALFLVVTGVVYLIYFNTFLLQDFAYRPELNGVMHQVMSIELLAALGIAGYIMLQFYNVNKYADTEKAIVLKDLHQKQAVLDQKNKEKTALLQEIHHRVKNNLQVIISLLRMQSSELKSEEAVKSFNEAISRIMTMSLIHQKMYEKESLAFLDLEDYLNTLINDTLVSYTTGAKVELDASYEQKIIGAKTIVPLGLIVNELVTNTVKHAFGDTEGVITLRLSAIKDNRFEMRYSDNGKWKEPKGGSFGLQLIEIFVDQLDGEMELSQDDKGTHYVFHFVSLDETEVH